MALARFDDGGRSSSSADCDSLLALLDDCDDAECAPIASLSAADLRALESLLGGRSASDANHEARAPASSSSSSFSSSSPDRVARSSKAKRAMGGADEEPAPRSWDPNRARKKQREELERLRLRADKLHAQLRELQAERRPDGTPAAHGRQSAAPSKWQRAAIRERVARARAEAANAHVKLVLENQRRVAESLEAFLRAAASTKEVLGALRRLERSDSYDSASESPDFSDEASADVPTGAAAAAHLSDALARVAPTTNGMVPGSKRPRLWLEARRWIRVRADGLARLWLRAHLRLPW